MTPYPLCRLSGIVHPPEEMHISPLTEAPACRLCTPGLFPDIRLPTLDEVIAAAEKSRGKGP